MYIAYPICGLFAIRPVCSIPGVIRTKLSSDSIWGNFSSFGRIGGTKNIPPILNHIRSHQFHGYYWTTGHEVNQRTKKYLVTQSNKCVLLCHIKLSLFITGIFQFSLFNKATYLKNGFEACSE